MNAGMDDDGATVHLASPAAEEYLDGVRAALADLPAPEVAEILDDVRAHLADLAAELGDGADVTALTARLGPPSAYAAELRAAAGYPAAEPEGPAGPATGSPGSRSRRPRWAGWCSCSPSRGTSPPARSSGC